MDKQAEIARIKAEYEARNKEIERQHRLEMAKIIGGGLLSIGSALIPGTAGLKVAGALGKTIAPMVGKKIGTEIASGLVSGGLSGAVEGFGRGLIENKNPLKTMAQDSAVGLATGGLGGLAIGKIGQNIARKSLPNNPTAQKQYFDDYIDGLANKTNAMADFRGLSQGAEGLNKPITKHNFIGENAFNINKADLNTAKLMKNQGYTPDEIFDKTGWFQGVDEKWRTEIPDGEIIQNPFLKKDFDADIGTYYTTTVGDLYDAPELYKNYPQLKDKSVLIQAMPEGTSGSSWGDSITLNRDLYTIEKPEYTKAVAELEQAPEYIEFKNYKKEMFNNLDKIKFETDDDFKTYDLLLKELDNKTNDFYNNTPIGSKFKKLVWETPKSEKITQGFGDNAKKTLIHELQHQIQGLEGFARGGNNFDAKYKELAGEVEARLASHRSKLLSDERRKFKPFDFRGAYGYDVKPEEQIVKFSGQEQFARDLAENSRIQNAIDKINNNPNKPLQELVYRNGEQVGYGDYFNYDDDAIYIDYLRNITKDTPNYQKGVGSEIMDKILQNNPNKNIIWDAVDDNAEAFKQAYLKKHPELTPYVFQQGDYDLLVALAKDQGYNINDYLELLRGKSKKTGL